MSGRPGRLVTAVAVAAVAVAAALTACGQQAQQDDPATTSQLRIPVVASINVWGAVAAAVGGDAVTVSSIVADSVGDPHSYQVSAKDAAALRAAALVVSNGGGYDDFVDQALGGDAPGRRVVAVDLHPDDGSDENEHVWYDLPTVAKVADRIAVELAQIRPAAESSFRANAEAFRGRLSGIQDQLRRLAAAHAGTPVAASEPVAHYLLQAVQLADRTPHAFVAAIEAESEPPASAVAELQQLLTHRQVAVLLHNPQTETPVIIDLVSAAHAAGVPVVEVTETLPAGKDYATWLSNQVQALADALQRP